MDKHSSLLRKFVNYGQKSSITLGTGLLRQDLEDERKRKNLRLVNFFISKTFFRL
jgi:hypothetical protein